MTASSLTDFLNEAQPEGFQAVPYYSPEGDTLTYFRFDRDHYAQRVDDLLTVYLDAETDDLVGWKIKGVRRLLDMLGKFDVRIEDNGDIPLGPFVLAGLTLTQEKFRAYYERCGEASKGARVNQRQLQPC